jgi:hypothetical protein
MGITVRTKIGVPSVSYGIVDDESGWWLLFLFRRRVGGDELVFATAFKDRGVSSLPRYYKTVQIRDTRRDFVHTATVQELAALLRIMREQPSRVVLRASDLVDAEVQE